MAKNVMKLLKPSPHRARNDFDLSHRHVFDANFGELLPATCIETVPGDNITLHASDLLRAIPFVSSPFLRAKQHLDVWFVPYHDLWHQFDAFITQKSEPVSSAFQAANYCPWVSQYELYDAINAGASGGKEDVIGRSIADRSYYLLQLLGYGDLQNAHGTSSDTYKMNPWRLAAYNYIWYNEYRQQYYDNGLHGFMSETNPAKLFNFDNLACDSVAHASVTTGLSGNLSALCQMRYRTWKKDLFTGVMPSTQFGYVSNVPISGTVALSGSATLSGSTGTDQARHKFYDDNGDLLTSITTVPSETLFTGYTGDEIYYYNQNQGASGIEQNLGSVVNAYDASLGNYSKDSEVRLGHHDLHTHALAGTASVTSTGTITGGNGFDILALRKAEAVQIWRENALRAGNRIKDNMMAHYGVASDFNDHRPTYLGSVSSPLNIGDIAATANSATGINDTVGDIAGKGISSLDEKVFKFHAKDFGVIMVMFSMLPEAEYDALGIERTNQLLESEDYFVPEYENLGLEAVSVANLSARNGKVSENYVYGYAPRYYAYKTKLDKVFGQFVGNGIFRTWSSQRTDVIASLDNYSQTHVMPLKLLYVSPEIFDANFNVGVSVSPQFLCDVYFDVDAVRPMSVTGLPFS